MADQFVLFVNYLNEHGLLIPSCSSNDERINPANLTAVSGNVTGYLEEVASFLFEEADPSTEQKSTVQKSEQSDDGFYESQEELVHS